MNGEDFGVLLPAISTIFSKRLKKKYVVSLIFENVPHNRVADMYCRFKFKVERAFILLTLSDRRLTRHHSTMDDLLITKANDNTWLDKERKGIIKRAV